jgi:hypothetical protein
MSAPDAQVMERANARIGTMLRDKYKLEEKFSTHVPAFLPARSRVKSTA